MSTIRTGTTTTTAITVTGDTTGNLITPDGAGDITMTGGNIANVGNIVTSSNLFIGPIQAPIYGSQRTVSCQFKLLEPTLSPAVRHLTI